ncbi:MAG: glycogen synthase [Candidatus Heimdallarchaeota archaeon]|nr:glycogen synthase [Candidatus Heimdallarchaeota archaeon]
MSTNDRPIIFIVSEEAGLGNKLGGISDVVHSEAKTIVKFQKRQKTKFSSYVVGPIFKGLNDWNPQKRVTRISELESTSIEPQIKTAIDRLQSDGVEVHYGEKDGINYLLLGTDHYETDHVKTETETLSKGDHIKAEAFKLVHLQSDKFDWMDYGKEFSHYLYFSHAVSELARTIDNISLHLHEFPTFYAGARLKQKHIPCRVLATFHATVPGRAEGIHSLETIKKGREAKINESDNWPKGIREGLAQLELLGKYADAQTFVGNQTRAEAYTYYGINGKVIRNGIEVTTKEINWKRKEKYNRYIRHWLAENIYEFVGGEKLNTEAILPWYTVSRIEIKNKGFHTLCDALVLRDIDLKNRILEGEVPEDTRIIFFLVAAEGRKDPTALPEGFPLIYGPDTLLGRESILYHEYIKKKHLDIESLIAGKRKVAAVLYPQWICAKDGGLGLSVNELAAGAIGGVFPSYYEPFLLTAPATGAQGTPCIVSRACGVSDAILDYRRMKGDRKRGGMYLVDNLAQTELETAMDIAVKMRTIDEAYQLNRPKFENLCQESIDVAKTLTWKEPTEEYLGLLLGEPSSSFSDDCGIPAASQ